MRATAAGPNLPFGQDHASRHSPVTNSRLIQDWKTRIRILTPIGVFLSILAARGNRPDIMPATQSAHLDARPGGMPATERRHVVARSGGMPAAQRGHVHSWQPVGPEDLEDFTPQSALIGAAPGLTEGEAVGAVANTGIGACCVAAPCTCAAGQTQAACEDAPPNGLCGVWTEKALCENDFCGCLVRACCDAAGNCVGDFLRSDCEIEDPPGSGLIRTWHIEASCVGASGLPTPICNRFDLNNCNWDNGLPLNDGGASRQHIHSGGGGTLPRYDFESADDFILRGPDNDRCLVNRIHAWWRLRPAGSGGSATPNGLPDLVGINVTIYSNFISPETGLNSPGGHGLVPAGADDLGNKVADTPGGVVYARHFPIPEGGLDMILEDLDGDPSNGFQPFCDPNPINGFETEHVYRTEIGLPGNEIYPPIQVNKNRLYWLVVQGLFPFNDGLRESLQTWHMTSQNNTGFRGMTHRTGNPEYVVNGQDVWVPRNREFVTPGSIPQTGNAATVRRCSVTGECCTRAGGAQGTCPTGQTCDVSAPLANTRLDFAFRLFGEKGPTPKPNDECAAAIASPQSAFDGVTAFDNTGATDDGPNPATCGDIGRDHWFTYSTTCDGRLTVSVESPAYDAALAIYEAPVCSADCVDDADCESPLSTCTAALCEAACGDDTTTIIVNPNETLLIRVGTRSGLCSAGGAPCSTDENCPIGETCVTAGKGFLRIDCEESCGISSSGNCCTDHTTGAIPEPVGCSFDACCEFICATPGLAHCCDDPTIGWNQSCADAACQSPVCACACLTCECPAGSFVEPETMKVACTADPDCVGSNAGAHCVNGFCDCGSDNNGGCNVTPEAFVELGALTCGTPASVCGTVYANGVRDTDWYRFSVPDDGDGVAEVNVAVTGNAPVGIRILSTDTDADPNVSFCREENRTCSGNDIVCDSNYDCPPPNPYCPTLPDKARLTVMDSIGTSSCQTRTLTVCLPAPGTYALFVSTVQTADNEGTLGDPIYDGFPCGTQNDYSFALSCNDGCQAGACCSCEGECLDALTNPPGIIEVQCLAVDGTFVGEATTCATLPKGFDCADHAHGCVNAVTLDCDGPPVLVDLTGADPNTERPPEEIYECGNSGHDPDDRAWFRFTATSTSAHVHTCDSVIPARDSLVAVFGSDCPAGGMCPSGAACTPGEDFCGAECCNPLVPLATAGCGDDECGFTGYLTNICINNLVLGETYFIQISNWDYRTNGLFTLELDCPCRGSCCEIYTGICLDDTPMDDCVAQFSEFDETRTCAERSSPCDLGACCAPDGGCSETVAPDCPGGSTHMPGTQCSTVVCNLHDTCDFRTGTFIFGPEPGDEAPFGFVSQYFNDPGAELWIERAENFVLKDNPDSPCLITQLQFPLFHTSHDLTNGCFVGGGSACTDTPGDYYGLIVTISKDEEGDDKGPACIPDCVAGTCTPGPDGDYHVGPGCKTSVVFGPAAGHPPPTGGTSWVFECQTNGQTSCEITMNFAPPIQLEKNTKYWLAIAPIWREVAGYSMVWFASIRFDGNFGQGYHSINSPVFTPSTATPNDMLFEMYGIQLPAPDCPYDGCILYADLAEPFCTVDVDDLVLMVQGYADPKTYPAADIEPCGGDGDVDVDDILNIVYAFGGTYLCAHPCPLGACCCTGNVCQENLTANECAFLGDGTFLGPSSTCASTTGGCCGTDGTCSAQTQSECEAGGGIFLGVCASCPYDTGACCTGATCFDQTRCQCLSEGGVFLGAGHACSGAGTYCCMPNRQCLYPDPTPCQCLAIGGIVGPCYSDTACCLAGECQAMNWCACVRAGGVPTSTCPPCGP